MLARGLVAETKRLRLGGVSIARIREFGFEYRATLAYLTGKIGRAELEGQLIRKTIGYARRQMTWFSRNPKIRWAQGTREAASLVRRFLTA
ncbi:MAG: hypothetical protein A3B37_02590 [Candidatus Sungbacteria bacterium RIFCSPLOWO2_01_FULL_59_16]|uniref:tRNA dimethylallyltransferase n=1 Tax=Candidatus Sungbacteria bacterium RIFCSPLOWO2_01_FULL_59_16 TaxID=1802280 RepID=A0A1G2LAR1_9BACT|nr:MAG: hypothetical protein A3B37_02590 [Candidatus Sungbacteria bacterium RIFCSPLOWO2_01_FULL_59_16]